MRFSFVKMLGVVVCAMFFLAPVSTYAADVFFSSSAARMEVGQEFSVRMMVDTEEEVVNAVEGRLVYPSEMVEVRAVRDGNSVVNLWAEKPRARDGQISFAGITPGGFSGERDMLFTVVFRAKRAGEIALRGEGFRILKQADSSDVEVSERSLQLAVVESIGDVVDAKEDAVISEVEVVPEVKIVDRDPPESFTPEISSDPRMFDGAFFLVFATQDKGSGVARYEVQEGGGDFEEVESPYVLKDQKLGKRITVKAIDYEGNARVHVLEPLRPRSLGLIVVGGVLIIVGLLFVVIRKLWRK